MAKAEYVSKEGMTEGVIEGWHKQYLHCIETPDEFSHPTDCDKKLTYEKLVELQKNGELTAKKVDEIIGNESWTALNCDGCGENVKDAVRVGTDVDYESSTTTLCTKCTNDALRVLREGKRNARKATLPNIRTH